MFFQNTTIFPMTHTLRWVASVFLLGLVAGNLPAQSIKVSRETPATTTIATNQLLVFLNPGQSAASLSRDYGLTLLGSLADAPNIIRFDASSAATAATAVVKLAADRRVGQAFVLPGNQRQGSSFTPNDPFYYPGANPPAGGPGDTSNRFYSGQWQLVNQMPGATYNDPTIQARLAGAWNRNLTGSGVVIGIIDDAVQISHPDLQPNTANIGDLSRHFLPGGGDVADPNPANNTQYHGTAVAGIAVARGGNGIGVTGAAPFAGLAGLRTDDYNTTALANAATWRNDAIQIKNHSYTFAASAPYINDSALAAVIASTATNPTNPVIHVFAAGNNRNNFSENANTAMLQASPHGITVAALGSNGKYANYSSFGANIFVTAPSSTTYGQGFDGTTTTDLVGTAGINQRGAANDDFANLDYTNFFGGTSAAAPLVSGVLALGVQARTQAGFTSDVRVMRHLLALTSRKVDAGDVSFSSDGGWRTNAAGYQFNQNYGFGLIDADALTAAAVRYSGVTAQVTHTKALTNVGAAIPDDDATGISRSFTINTNGKLEDVLVTLNITHTWRGDLEAYITSPSGYTSRLMTRDGGDDGDNINWTFQTVAFWGEEVNGTWTVRVTDNGTDDIGTWDSYAVTFHTGELVPVPEPTTVLGIGVAAMGIGRLIRRRWLKGEPAAAA